MADTCKTCIYYEEVVVDTSGNCRCHCPTVVSPHHIDVRAHYPPTPETQWCGEWKEDD